MGKNIVGNVWWVGKVDWELRKFHGDEYSTHRGSSYNSYLIKEGKTVLIDTVWKPYAKEFVANLEKDVDLASIDYVVANHAEVDHSGALPELMSRIPETPVYCSENGVKSLRGHYHKDWNFKTVKTGDSLDLGGGKKLVFVETRMLHWPDSIASYLTGDNVLFSCDAFGEHFATERLFNDLVDQDELYAEAIKYYANILTPFSALVTKKIEEILALQLRIDYIAPSHGVIWRDKPTQIVEKYLAWADSWKEDQITIMYDTMWEGTRTMAENIALGISSRDRKVVVKLYNVSKTDKNDVIAEVFRSKAIVVGSPTVNRGITSAMAGILEEIEGLKFRGKKAAAFGSYGWSGESVERLNERLAKAGFEIADEGLKCLWNPDEPALGACKDFGARLAEKTS